MQIVKTTVVFPKNLWEEFQKITGKKRTSKVLTKLTGKMVQSYNAQKLLNKKPDPSWTDEYLEKSFYLEMENLKQTIS